MIEVIAIFCSIVGVCQDVKVATTAEAITPHGCFLYGQIEAAKWAIEHPGWSPRGITCQRAGRYAKI
jgi:hypothetical protein